MGATLKIIPLVALIIPSRAYGAAGFADDGVGTIVLVGMVMALLAVIATGGVALRWLFRRAAPPATSSHPLVWGAWCFPLSVVLGITVAAQNGPFGVVASLADPGTYFFGCIFGAFICVVVLPVVLITAFLNRLDDDSRRRAGVETVRSDRDSS